MADSTPKRPSPELARRAYRQLAKRLHPDAGGSDVEMARLARAYANLADSARRVAPEGPRIIRTQRERLRLANPQTVWSAEAEQFSRLHVRPQDRLLEVALDRLELALLAHFVAPKHAERAELLQQVTAQTTNALTMAGTRLGRLTWPADLAPVCQLLGEALRLLSDALIDLDGEPNGAAAQTGLTTGRARLREARALLPPG